MVESPVFAQKAVRVFGVGVDDGDFGDVAGLKHLASAQEVKELGETNAVGIGETGSGLVEEEYDVEELGHISLPGLEIVGSLLAEEVKEKTWALVAILHER